MTDNYILMHKDISCGILAVDRDSGALTDCKITEREYAPFLGNADERLMKIWWGHRAVPGTRRDMEEIIRRAGCENSQVYLAKNLALSLTDSYWICPIELDLKWEEVNLFQLCQSDREVVEYHNGTSYDPNASLGGQMNKLWDVSGKAPILRKKAYEYYGQQSVNEVFASGLHSQQNSGVPFVKYEINRADDNVAVSSCEAFTSESVELVTAYEVLRSRKAVPGRSDYDLYIDICEEYGIDRDTMQESMDHMTLSDFAISNIDRHLQNFGVLRDTISMRLIGPAPLFDSGNSMFFNLNGSTPLTRKQLLKAEISSLHRSEEKMLRHVKNRKSIDIEKLPSTQEVVDFYTKNGIPEERALFIAGSYENKLSLLNDFIKGEEISLYRETHQHR